MGWASGSELARPIIQAVKDNVTDNEARRRIYVALLNAFRDADWDTIDEAMGIDHAFDEVADNDEHDE